jgi:hypothetical protein
MIIFTWSCKIGWCLPHPLPNIARSRWTIKSGIHLHSVKPLRIILKLIHLARRIENSIPTSFSRSRIRPTRSAYAENVFHFDNPINMNRPKDNAIIWMCQIKIERSELHCSQFTGG